jgi:hypothetical protein
MAIVARSGEALARVIDRRSFLDRTAKLMFGVVAGGVATFFNPLAAEAVCDFCTPGWGCTSPATACGPPGGLFCPGANDCNVLQCSCWLHVLDKSLRYRLLVHREYVRRYLRWLRF